MNTEIYCGRKEERGDFDIVLDYYIVPQLFREDFSDVVCYGIKVVETSYYDGGGRCVESVQVDNVFCRRDDADAFIKLICNGSVTPVELRDVIEDYVVASLSV